MSFIYPLAIIGASYAVPKVFNSFYPSGIEKEDVERKVQKFLISYRLKNPSEIQDPMPIEGLLEQVVKITALSGLFFRRIIDQMLFFPPLYHLFTVVIPNNLWLSTATVCFLWQVCLKTIIDGWLGILMVSMSIPVFCLSFHSIRLQLSEFSCLSPSFNLSVRILPFLDPDMSVNDIWQLFYQKLFNYKKTFEEDFLDFEQNLQQIIFVIAQRCPQLKEDDLYQLLTQNKVPNCAREDAVLGQYFCPITNQLIQEPYQEIGSEYIYEKKAILNMLARNNFKEQTEIYQENRFFQQIIQTGLLRLKIQLFCKKVGIEFPKEELYDRYAGFCKKYRQEHPRHKLIQTESASCEIKQCIDFIPEELDDDDFFAQYICPITLSPIRHPLRDPISGNIYEARAIIQWVREYGTSPLSNYILRVEKLEPVLDLQKEIDEMLILFNVIKA